MDNEEDKGDDRTDKGGDESNDHEKDKDNVDNDAEVNVYHTVKRVNAVMMGLVADWQDCLP